MGYIADKDTVINFVKSVKQQNLVINEYGIRITFYGNPFNLTYELLGHDKYNALARFTLKEQINCCGILVSTDTFIAEQMRGRGIAHEFMNLKIAIAKEFGYSLLMATVDIGNNPAEVHILEKFGWKKVDEFINKRTRHTLGIFTLETK